MFFFTRESIVPLRIAPSERSEMVSQLLFGEQGTVLEEQKKWLKIKGFDDDYVGWADRKMLVLSDTEFPPPAGWVLPDRREVRLYRSDGTIIHIPAGAYVPALRTPYGSEQFSYSGFQPGQSYGKDALPEVFKLMLDKYQGTPYLWGGKSPFGIDCSGLTQIFYRFFGIKLPRDAKDQVNAGKIIPFDQKKPGDLAFFTGEEGKITHTGIVFDNGEILHASGRVRRDNLTPEGIIKDGELTHRLHSICTFFIE